MITAKDRKGKDTIGDDPVNLIRCGHLSCFFAFLQHFPMMEEMYT